MFGVRFSRDHILRLSAILSLRALLTVFDLPLENTATAYITSLLSSMTNMAIVLALTSNYFHFEGLLGRIGAFFFPSPRKPSAFIILYARLVFVLGPLASWFETAVITYEIMSIARRWEASMQRAATDGSHVPRRLLLAFTFLCITGSVAIGVTLGLENRKVGAGAATASLLLLTYSYLNDDANVVEAAMLSLYVCTLLIFAKGESQLLSDESRAMLLVGTVVLLCTAMSRATRFVRLLAIGFEEFYREEEAGIAWGQGSVQNSFGVLTIIAITFRILIWSQEVHEGEYVAEWCRITQVIAVVILYIFYSQR
ncbi:hypothetical protein BWQ96_08580 [Gracilariopsis chorda]|uniref:Uncharacterized protein n=1 Tax=Gracilariopsis chorda TaxID=448386 RepID=A0A2V3IHW0_9FLOR|nr:hypothetical protein BWQ96_08580 [Gracilariopsis chorda]|eukprot:PXF41695.1 hypothetical protein BWQ96_08580 [Gracilariopsis chorda]